MTSLNNFKDIEEQLNEVNKKNENGVSFSGKALKLNEEADASDVIKEIEECEKLEFLDLEGNTLGPEAARAISEALSKKAGDLKRALWKDMFTGRMKNEIPKALEYLGQGLCSANTRLVELDLSDNAFGPIGVQGLAALLTSSSCYTLQQLRLNNNGLGISGGKMLAQALLDCNRKSLQETNKPLGLKVFIAGRNRLENDGAKALAQVFETLKSLEEVVMPQNGIYHVGVSALATALSANSDLRILNLNDNTVGLKGATALAKALPSFSNLEKLNLGDCLLKTKGAIVITKALSEKGNHPSLTELNLSFNEIRKHAINSIADAVEDKELMKTLILDGNYFGSNGCEDLRKQLVESNRIESLGSLWEDASDDDESGDEDNTNDEDEDDEETDEDNDEEIEDNDQVEIIEQQIQHITVDDFLKNPIGKNLLSLQGNKTQSFIDHVTKNINGNKSLKYSEELLKVIMKVSSLCDSSYVDVRTEAENVSDALYEHLFEYASENNLTPAVNNELLINLGLIKPEDKSRVKIDWELESCFKALEKISQRSFFPKEAKKTLILFIEKPSRPSRIKDSESLKDVKNALKAVLEKSA